MPRVAPIAPSEIRPAPSAPQRNEGSDPFSQLLNATAGDDRDTPLVKDEPKVQPGPADRDAVSRADNDYQADRSGRQDSAKADSPPSDKTGAGGTDDASAQANPTSANTDDPASDPDGKPKDQDKDSKASADAAATAAPDTPPVNTVSQPGLIVSVAAGIGIAAAVEQAAANADTATPPANGAVAEAADGVAPVNVTPPVPNAAIVPDTASLPAGAPMAVSDPAVAQAAAAGGLIADAAKTAAGAKAEPAPKTGDTDGKNPKMAATGTADGPDAETAGKPPATLAASITAAAKLALGFAPASSAPGQDGAGKQTNAADLKVALAATVAAKASAETNAAKGAAAPRESLETVLARHLSADIQPSGQSQIALPGTTHGFASALHSAGAPAPLQSSGNAGQPVPPTSMAIAVAIAARSRDGSNQFQIRLDPPELGRIDVKLDVDKSGQVNTHLTVDRPETLDLLQRDARGLERALQQAGLKTGNGGLEFSLRQQTPDGSYNGRTPGQAHIPPAIPSIEEGVRAAASVERHQWTARLRGGVDIRV